jgi:hypothetical protein
LLASAAAEPLVLAGLVQVTEQQRSETSLFHELMSEFQQPWWLQEQSETGHPEQGSQGFQGAYSLDRSIRQDVEDPARE